MDVHQTILHWLSKFYRLQNVQYWYNQGTGAHHLYLLSEAWREVYLPQLRLCCQVLMEPFPLLSPSSSFPQSSSAPSSSLLSTHHIHHLHQLHHLHLHFHRHNHCHYLNFAFLLVNPFWIFSHPYDQDLRNYNDAKKITMRSFEKHAMWHKVVILFSFKKHSLSLFVCSSEATWIRLHPQMLHLLLQCLRRFPPAFWQTHSTRRLHPTWTPSTLVPLT